MVKPKQMSGVLKRNGTIKTYVLSFKRNVPTKTKVSEYDQEIPQSQTADQPTVP